jgi:Zn finger protein HypA/HybF involved in hydrogenase expression
MEDATETTNKTQQCEKTKKFIEKAKQIHGDLYDYSESVYVNYKAKLKIKINCPKHPETFLSSPVSHYANKAKGCPRCVKKSNVRLTTEQFIKISTEIHGGKYDYSLAVYTNKYGKVKIKCNKCNDLFEQIAESHYTGCGCMRCYGNLRKSKEEFVIRAKQIYPNNEYNYSEVEYRSNRTKIKITHNKCGNSYMQIAKDHFRFGCPICAERFKVSKPETEWLNTFNIPKEFRQFVIKTNETVKDGIRKQWFNVDGFDPKTNTVYEFLGDYWHGNILLERYAADKINPRTGTTFGELNAKTMKKLDKLKEMGYNIVFIWESDYKAQLKKQKLSLE